jgi:hypothetical protein
MLVNLSKSKKKVKILRQLRKWSLRRVENHSEQKWAAEQKKWWKAHPFKFEYVFKPYTPCGDEYVPDTMTDFTGVYLFAGYDEKQAIDGLTKNRCIEDLVDYGCVDNASQAIECFNEHFKYLHEEYGEKGNYVILMRPMRRSHVHTFEEAMGTFRWHKNGGYSGKANVCSEYFLDEPDERLTLVYTYTVCKVA